MNENKTLVSEILLQPLCRSHGSLSPSFSQENPRNTLLCVLSACVKCTLRLTTGFSLVTSACAYGTWSVLHLLLYERKCQGQGFTVSSCKWRQRGGHHLPTSGSPMRYARTPLGPGGLDGVPLSLFPSCAWDVDPNTHSNKMSSPHHHCSIFKQLHLCGIHTTVSVFL